MLRTEHGHGHILKFMILYFYDDDNDMPQVYVAKYN